MTEEKIKQIVARVTNYVNDLKEILDRLNKQDKNEGKEFLHLSQRKALAIICPP